MSMNSATRPKRPLKSTLSTTLTRGVAFFALWMVLMQSIKPADLAVGAFATLGATWLSLHLFAPAAGHLRFGSLFALLPHFLRESVRAGIDVARRAFDPRLPLRTGFVDCPLDFPPGLARNTFATITSLMPGTVPADATDDALIYHCLDTAQPVVEALWKEEKLLARALIAGRRHG
ncbi:MAG: sodium:proton antiporter [Thiobacillus sp.]|nr:sodium:proton antiporter [Thiobacillus sp.]